MNAVMEQPQTRNVSLYYREGSSDKEYHVSLEPKNGGYVVNFAYGRRGSTLSTGTKTTKPVDYEDAVQIFDKLIREKKAKGYTEAPTGKTYQHSDNASKDSGVRCQLLNPIEEKQVHQLIQNPDWWMQEKFDGRRLLIRKIDNQVEGINRRGLVIGLPTAIQESALALNGDFIMDGECVGDVLYAFDLLAIDSVGIENLAYDERYAQLIDLVAMARQSNIEIVLTAETPEEKLQLFTKLQQQKREGVVLKFKESTYAPGRPNSGGHQLKHKFYASLSAVVTKLNSQRSVEVSLLAEEGWVAAGNVTIPPNYDIPSKGQIVEVRYLYAFLESGKLYQPTFLGPRHDLTHFDCTVQQLKFKPQDQDDET